MSKVNKIQDINQFGLDVESELTRILTEELAKSIDKQILRGLGIETEKNSIRKNKINKIFSQT